MTHIKLRSAIAIAIAAIGGTAGFTAQAQSTVTIYGRLNTTVERVKFSDAGAVYQLVNNASRIGFRGTEDLGNGLRAGFQIEHGFNVDTGTQSQTAFWARQSEVNLGGNFGMVRLGNFVNESYYATADYVSMHNHDTGNSADALYAYVANNTNKIAYRTPSFSGATLEVARTFGEGVPKVGGGAVQPSYDVAANYKAGPLHLGAGYSKNDNVRQFAIRGLYEMGPFTFGGYIQRDKDAFAVGNRTNIRVSGMYTMGQAEFHLNYGRAGKTGNITNSEGSQATAGINYNLSKRTKIYGFYTRLHDDGAHLYVGGVAPHLTATTFSSVAVGVRHNF